jgi:hypothetical protein
MRPAQLFHNRQWREHHWKWAQTRLTTRSLFFFRAPQAFLLRTSILQALKVRFGEFGITRYIMTERKKREKAERKLATEETANREPRSDLKVCNPNN